MQKNGVVVDTSVWIQFFNAPESPEKHEVVKLLRNSKVFLCGMELSEILQGTRGEEERNEIEETMSILPFLGSDISTWKKIGQTSSVLLRKGVTIPLTDLFIGVIAINNNCRVFTLDKHFEKIPEIALYVPDSKGQPQE